MPETAISACFKLWNCIVYAYLLFLSYDLHTVLWETHCLPLWSMKYMCTLRPEQKRPPNIKCYNTMRTCQFCVKFIHVNYTKINRNSILLEKYTTMSVLLAFKIHHWKCEVSNTATMVRSVFFKTAHVGMFQIRQRPVSVHISLW